MIEALVATATAMPVAVLSWWLTNKSRDQADAKAERATLEAQADALILAVADLKATATTNHILWEGPVEQWRSFLLACLAAAGGYSRARLTGRGSDRLWGAAGLAAAGRSLSQDRRDAKLATAGVTASAHRLAAAAVPLLRHPDRDLATATRRLVEAAHDVRNPAQVDAAGEAFGQAVSAALSPPPSRWRRRSSSSAAGAQTSPGPDARTPSTAAPRTGRRSAGPSSPARRTAAEPAPPDRG
ncbi:hypothetical protein OOK40_32750 [Streptomyces sp. NBC_01481]|nr:hypothetical protein [Streptomyces sp. NBC_01481]